MSLRSQHLLQIIGFFFIVSFAIVCTRRWLESPVIEIKSRELTIEMENSITNKKESSGKEMKNSIGNTKKSSGNVKESTENVQKSSLRVETIQAAEVDHVFDGVPVRVYMPVHRTTDILQGIVWYHGGGWTQGSLDSVAYITRQICKETNSVVVSVNYRLAPKHIFPAAFDDCVAATKYFIINAEQFQVNSTRIAIGGDSAGGNLAAAVALKLRDERFSPTVKFQILVHPVMQALDFQLPSYVKYRKGPTLSRSGMVHFTLMYLEGNDYKKKILTENGHVSPSVKKKGLPFIDVSKLPKKYLVGYTKPSVHTGNKTIWNKMKDKLLNPYFSPLVANSLNDLPPTYVFTAERDPLRDEGILYAKRLEESGVRVSHHHSKDAAHTNYPVSQICQAVSAGFANNRA